MNPLKWKLRRTACLIGLLTTGTGLALVPSKEPETGETRAVKAQFIRQVERIKSLEVHYKLTTRSNLSPEKLRALPEYMNQLFLPEDEWDVAFKGEKRYVRQLQPERITYLVQPGEYGLASPAEPPADAPPQIKENQKELKKQYDRAVANMKAQEARGVRVPKRDPAIRPLGERDVTRGYNGKTLWVRKAASPRGYHYETWSAGSHPNFFQVSAFLGAVGLHVPDPKGSGDARKAQAMFQLAEWIKDPSYQLERNTEVVDGSTCVVIKGSLNSILRPGFLAGDLTDRIWLDRDHGLVLRKRETARDGKVTFRWINTGLKEVEPGLWLPTRTRQEQFGLIPHPELKGEPILIEETHVKDLSVNKVADSLFDMSPKKGDVIDDLRGR